jgi:hypothetical protein
MQRIDCEPCLRAGGKDSSFSSHELESQLQIKNYIGESEYRFHTEYLPRLDSILYKNLQYTAHLIANIQRVIYYNWNYLNGLGTGSNY